MISTKLTPDVIESGLRAAAELWENVSHRDADGYLSEQQQEALALALEAFLADRHDVLDLLPERCRITSIESGE